MKQVQQAAAAVLQQLKTVVFGKRPVLELVFNCLLDWTGGSFRRLEDAVQETEARERAITALKEIRELLEKQASTMPAIPRRQP